MRSLVVITTDFITSFLVWLLFQLRDLGSKVLSSSDTDFRIVALRALAKTKKSKFLDEFKQHFQKWSVQEQQLGLLLLGDLNIEGGVQMLNGLISQLLDETLSPKLALDVLSACEKLNDPDLQSKLRLYRQRQKESADEVSGSELLFGGNADKGREIFEDHIGAQCVRCHDAGGSHRQVGPELKGLGRSKNRAYLLESLLTPSAKLAEGFELTMMTLTDGMTMAGRVVQETEKDLKFVSVTGEFKEFTKTEIRNIQEVRASSMPPMQGILSPFEIRDLIEFLATWE